jgi:hypothetical protein
MCYPYITDKVCFELYDTLYRIAWDIHSLEYNYDYIDYLDDKDPNALMELKYRVQHFYEMIGDDRKDAFYLAWKEVK